MALIQDRRQPDRDGPTPRFASRTVLAALFLFAGAVAMRGLSGCGGSPDDLFSESTVGTKNERFGRVLETLASDVAVPAYDAFASAADGFAEAAGTFCDTLSAERLAAAQAGWRRAMAAWISASVPQFGPIREDNRNLRVQFWPDQNNNVPRSVEQVLAGTDPITAESLAGRSVAAQGLPAAEQLLFDPDGDPLGAFLDGARGVRRCALLRAIATNLRTIASETATAWERTGGNYASALARSGGDNGAFASRGAAVEEVLNSLVTVVERTKNDRLGKPLALPEGGEPLLARAESRRSRTSLVNVERAVAALRRFYLGGEGETQGYGFDDFLRLGGDTSLHTKIDDLFATVLAHLRGLPSSLDDAVADPADRAELDALYADLGRLTSLLKNDLAEATGVVVGFNENDGD